MTLVLAAALVVVVAVPVVAVVISRPQRGMLALAALLPFDGLLLLLGDAGAAAGPWKEAVLVLVLAATFVAPATARRLQAGGPPSWVGIVGAYVVLGAVAGLVTGGVVGLWGFKIGYFYALVPVILWRCPFDRRDRDRLMTVLMTTGVITAVVGLGQQVVGDERLAALGYEYNTAIRFAGSLLRSFSTFTQPFSFGLFVCLVLLICFPVALQDPRRTRNSLFLVLTPVLLAGMASSVVRGAFLCLAVGALVLAMRRYRGLLHLAFPAVLAVALVPSALVATFVSSSSLGQRTSGWGTVAERVVSAPWGNGLGITGAAAEKALEQGADPRSVLVLDGQRYQPDNQFVKVAIELGVVGLWLLLLLLAAVVHAAVRASDEAGIDGRDEDQALCEGIAASTVGVAAASLVSNYLEIFPLDFYFWLALGVLLCLGQTSRSTRSPSGRVVAASRPTSGSTSAR